MLGKAALSCLYLELKNRMVVMGLCINIYLFELKKNMNFSDRESKYNLTHWLVTVTAFAA